MRVDPSRSQHVGLGRREHFPIGSVRGALVQRLSFEIQVEESILPLSPGRLELALERPADARFPVNQCAVAIEGDQFEFGRVQCAWAHAIRSL